MNCNPPNKVSSLIINPHNQNTSQWICQWAIKPPKSEKITIFALLCTLLYSKPNFNCQDHLASKVLNNSFQIANVVQNIALEFLDLQLCDNRIRFNISQCVRHAIQGIHPQPYANLG
jgi:hypothetical protein